jgi:hypothetical protein
MEDVPAARMGEDLHGIENFCQTKTKDCIGDNIYPTYEHYFDESFEELGIVRQNAKGQI